MSFLTNKFYHAYTYFTYAENTCAYTVLIIATLIAMRKGIADGTVHTEDIRRSAARILQVIRQNGILPIGTKQ